VSTLSAGPSFYKELTGECSDGTVEENAEKQGEEVKGEAEEKNCVTEYTAPLVQ